MPEWEQDRAHQSHCSGELNLSGWRPLFQMAAQSECPAGYSRVRTSSSRPAHSRACRLRDSSAPTQETAPAGSVFGGDPACEPDSFGPVVSAEPAAGTRMQNFVGHAGIGVAGKDRVDLHIVLPDLFGDRFDKPGQRRFTGCVRREVRTRRRPPRRLKRPGSCRLCA